MKRNALAPLVAHVDGTAWFADWYRKDDAGEDPGPPVILAMFALCAHVD